MDLSTAGGVFVVISITSSQQPCTQEGRKEAKQVHTAVARVYISQGNCTVRLQAETVELLHFSAQW